MSAKAFVVGISGGTCSGKTTITRNLETLLQEKYNVCVFNMDNYYDWSKLRTVAPVARIEYPEHNHPGAVVTDKLYRDFKAAVYDENNDIVLIEGLFSLYFDKLREDFDLKIFVDLKSDERLYRRIKRMGEGNIDETALRYLDTVRYRHDEFVEPTRWYADLIINGAFNTNIGTDIIVSYIEAKMGK